MLILALAAGVTACDGCKEPPPEPTPTVVPDATVKPEEEPIDPLAEAKEEADKLAESNAISLSDTARAVTGEIEAAQKKAAKAKPRKPRPEPETGKLAKAELNKVFNFHMGAMKKCYERSLKGTPGLAGKVRLELAIRSSGDVRTAKARGVSLKDDSVQNCMERQAKTMKFPAPDGGALRVTKTYSFAPEF